MSSTLQCHLESKPTADYALDPYLLLNEPVLTLLEYSGATAGSVGAAFKSLIVLGALGM